MPFAFPKPRPRILDKRDRQRDAEREQRSVYAQVAERDQRRCRCCGRDGQYDASGLKGLHRHHLVYRSKRGPTTTDNLLTLCAVCHALEHAKQLVVIGTDANRPLTFEIHEAAVVDAFGTKPLPKSVRIICESRRRA